MDYKLRKGEEARPLATNTNYIITTHARVWSNYSNKWLKPQIMQPGSYHRMVRLYMGTTEGKHSYVNHSISTLVGRTFLPEYKEGDMILHINEELSPTKVNRLDNLRVGDAADNARDTVAKDRHRHRWTNYHRKHRRS